MARTRTDAPAVFEAVRLEDADDAVEDKDSQLAWDQWIDDLRRSAAPGTIRVAKLPTDEQGAPLPNAKGQVQLGSWPHDQFDYDGLLAYIRQKFMKPGECMHIRITGMETGKPGVKVNQIVSLQREAVPAGSEVMTSQLGEVLTAMREDRAMLTQTLQSLMAPKESAPVMPTQTSPLLGESLKIGLPILGSIVTALISRPAKPPADIAGLIEIAKMLQGKTDEPSDDGAMSIIKAVAPGGLQLLNTLAANQRVSASKQNPAQSPSPVNAHVIAGAPQKVTAMPPVAAPSPGAPAPTPSTMSPSPAPAQEDVMIAHLKPHLTQLCELAANNADPQEVAKLTLDFLPPELEEQFATLVSDTEKFERLKLLEPKMKDHAPWFELLRVALENELYLPDDPPPSPLAKAA